MSYSYGADLLETRLMWETLIGYLPYALGGGVIVTVGVFILLVLRRPTLPGGLDSPSNTYRRLFKRSLGGGLAMVALLLIAALLEHRGK